MNWGTKIVIGMACFMTFIVALGILMVNSKTDALVDTDYYERGLNYDADYNRKEQVKADDAAPGVSVSAEGLILTFKDHAEGRLKMMRSSDKGMDRTIAIKTDILNRVGVPLTGLKKGQWKLIISWTSAEKSYLHEQEVIVE